MSVGNMTIKDALAKAIGPQAATELVERVDAKLRIGASKEDIGAKVTAFITSSSGQEGGNYQLDPSEIAEVLGTAVEYNISEVADRNVGVVARIRKALLAPIKRGLAGATPNR